MPPCSNSTACAPAPCKRAGGAAAAVLRVGSSPTTRQACAKFLADAELPGRLETLKQWWGALEGWDAAALDQALRQEAERQGVKPAVLIHPVRMALTNATGGPSLFDLVAVTGREAALRHLEQFVAFLRQT